MSWERALASGTQGQKHFDYVVADGGRLRYTHTIQHGSHPRRLRLHDEDRGSHREARGKCHPRHLALLRCSALLWARRACSGRTSWTISTDGLERHERWR